MKLYKDQGQNLKRTFLTSLPVNSSTLVKLLKSLQNMPLFRAVQIGEPTSKSTGGNSTAGTYGKYLLLKCSRHLKAEAFHTSHLSRGKTRVHACADVYHTYL